MVSQDVRVPPHNIEAEVALLGSVLIDNRVMDSIQDLVAAEDFYRADHRVIFEHLSRLHEARSPLDTITLYDALKASGQLDSVGGPEYLAELAEVVPTAANAQEYARIVRDNATLRRFIGVSSELVEEAYHGVTEVDDFLDRAEGEILAVADRGTRDELSSVRELLKPAFQALEARMKDRREVTGLTTGFVELDKLTAGLQRSDLIILAARPSMGKTSLGLNMAVNAAIEAGATVGVFSLEMSKQQLVLRMVASQARVPQEKLRTGYLTDENFQDLFQAAEELSRASIYIDDTPALNYLALRSKCRRLKSEHGLDLVVVDYLQLMRGPRNISSREQEISEISRSLKALAKEMDVPVMALSQLNRELEKRQDKRPKLADLRESGAIEQDADLVLFIYRDEVYNENSPQKGVAEIIIAKHRNGPLGTVQVSFQGAYTRFDNLASEDYSSY